jgi:hypothetical protein
MLTARVHLRKNDICMNSDLLSTIPPFIKLFCAFCRCIFPRYMRAPPFPQISVLCSQDSVSFCSRHMFAALHLLSNSYECFCVVCFVRPQGDGGFVLGFNLNHHRNFRGGDGIDDAPVLLPDAPATIGTTECAGIPGEMRWCKSHNARRCVSAVRAAACSARGRLAIRSSSSPCRRSSVCRAISL